MADNGKKQRALNIALLVTEFIAALINLFKSAKTTSARSDGDKRDKS